MSTDQQRFAAAEDALQGEVNALTLTALHDAGVRRQYQQAIRQAVDAIKARAARREITWVQAAEEVNRLRNTTMEWMRGRSSPIGRALAEYLKPKGLTLNELIARRATQLFGEGIDFNRLKPSEKNRVYAEIVEGAARSRPSVDNALRKVARYGRGLMVLSIAISVYEVATAEDPARQAGRELATTGAGIAGGVAGGALAGLACGPGAPVCVTVGAFVGGTLAALGVSLAW